MHMFGFVITTPRELCPHFTNLIVLCYQPACPPAAVWAAVVLPVFAPVWNKPAEWSCAAAAAGAASSYSLCKPHPHWPRWLLSLESSGVTDSHCERGWGCRCCGRWCLPGGHYCCCCCSRCHGYLLGCDHWPWASPAVNDSCLEWCSQHGHVWHVGARLRACQNQRRTRRSAGRERGNWRLEEDVDARRRRRTMMMEEEAQERGSQTGCPGHGKSCCRHPHPESPSLHWTELHSPMMGNRTRRRVNKMYMAPTFVEMGFVKCEIIKRLTLQQFVYEMFLPESLNRCLHSWRCCSSAAERWWWHLGRAWWHLHTSLSSSATSSGHWTSLHHWCCCCLRGRDQPSSLRPGPGRVIGSCRRTGSPWRGRIWWYPQSSLPRCQHAGVSSVWLGGLCCHDQASRRVTKWTCPGVLPDTGRVRGVSLVKNKRFRLVSFCFSLISAVFSWEEEKEGAQEAEEAPHGAVPSLQHVCPSCKHHHYTKI